MAIRLDVDVNGQSGLDRLNRSLGQTRNNVNRLERAFQVLGAIDFATNIGRQIITITRRFGESADQLTRLVGQLRATGSSAALASRQLAEVARISQDTGQNFEAVASTFARIQRSTRDLGISTRQVAQATTTIQQSFVVAGSSAQEAAAASLQLGQALGSGVLQGDELRSILENNVVLAQAIAREFGVSVGQLRDLGRSGQLTSERVFQAILNDAESINTQFTQINGLFSQSFQRIGNAATLIEGVFFRSLDHVTGINMAIQSVTDRITQAFEDGTLEASIVLFIDRAGQLFFSLRSTIREAFASIGIDINDNLNTALAGFVVAAGVTTAFRAAGLAVAAAFRLGFGIASLPFRLVRGVGRGMLAAVRGATSRLTFRTIGRTISRGVVSGARFGRSLTTGLELGAAAAAAAPIAVPLLTIALAALAITVEGSPLDEYLRERLQDISYRISGLFGGAGSASEAQRRAASSLSGIVTGTEGPFSRSEGVSLATVQPPDAVLRLVSDQILLRLVARLNASLSALTGDIIPDNLQQTRLTGFSQLRDRVLGILSQREISNNADGGLIGSLPGYQLGGLIGPLIRAIGPRGLQFLRLAGPAVGVSTAANRTDTFRGIADYLLRLLGYDSEGNQNGGRIRGPGTGRSDSILARVSNGEFVVNASATRQFLPLLEQINGYQFGGAIGDPRVPSGIRSTALQALIGRASPREGTEDLFNRVVESLNINFNRLLSAEARMDRLEVGYQSRSIDLLLEQLDHLSEIDVNTGQDRTLGSGGGNVFTSSVREFRRGFADALARGLRGDQNFFEALADNFSNVIITAFSNQIASNLFSSNFLSAVTGGGNIFSTLFAGIFHDGGIVPGTPGTTVPILAQAGERVVPRSQVRNESGTTVFNLNVTGDISRQTRNEITTMIPQLATQINAQNRRTGALRQYE